MGRTNKGNNESSNITLERGGSITLSEDELKVVCIHINMFPNHMDRRCVVVCMNQLNGFHVSTIHGLVA